MRTIQSLAAITFLALAAATQASPDKETILQAEKNIWQLIKDKKFDDFQKHLVTDFRGVYGSGISKRDAEIADVKKLDLKSFALSDIDLVMINKDAALVTYTVAAEGTSEGKDIPPKMHAATVWKKEGSDWRVVFHTDVKAE